MLVWRCHQLLPGFLAIGYLARASHQTRLSTNNKGDNEMKQGAVHRSPGIYLTAEENPSLETVAVRPVIASNGVSYLQMRSVGSHRTSGRGKKGNKEKMGLE